MAKTIDAENVAWMADELDREHRDDVWRQAASQHLRSAANFLRLAEQHEEAERVAAEARAAQEADAASAAAGLEE